MNKKVNSVLFLLGATIFNIIVTLLFIFLFGFIYLKFLIGYFSSDNAHFWAFVLIFIGSILISFFIYRFLLGFLLKKINIEKYFDPLFRIKSRN